MLDGLRDAQQHVLVAARGAKLEATISYKTLQPVGGTWRVLMHIDGPVRLNGDHEPIDGRCQTSTWQPGDFIVDRHTINTGGAIGSVVSPTKVSVGANSARGAPGTGAEATIADQEGRIIRGVFRYAAPLLLGMGVLTALALLGGRS